jgi:diacylglycerol O-acyltransferase
MTRRLSFFDLAFFVLENAQRPMNVGPLIILKPPAGRDGPRFADALYKRMMQRPVGAPFNLKLAPSSLTALPALVPDPDFDLADHVHRIRMRKPGTIDAVLAKICKLHTPLLDRSRPLWDFYLFDGIEGGRVALYARMHHGTVDGAGFLKIISRWLSTSPKDRVVRAMWEGVDGRKSVQREHDSSLGGIDRLLQAGTGAARTALSFSQLLWQQGLATFGKAPGVPLPFVGTPDVLKAAPSANRSFAHCTLPLGELKALGKTRDATVNDMLLTILDMALIRYLDSKGIALAAPLVADMPVALGGGGSGGNRIAIMQIPLGAPGLDPAERLAAISEKTRALKGQMHDGTADAAMLHSVITHGVPSLLEALRLDNAPLLANLVVSNPFGFTEKRYLMGAEVEMSMPISVVAPGQVLNITAVNYVDRYQIAFLALAEAVPDIGLLARCTEEAFTTLAAELRGDGGKRRTRSRPASPRTRKKA